MMPTELPRGWARVPLTDIADVIMGQSPPGSTYNTTGQGLPFFQGKAEFGDLYPHPGKWCTAPTKVAEPADVLISVRAPVGPTNLCRERSAIGRGLAAVRPREGVPSRYLLYALRASAHELQVRSTGSTFAAISGAVLRSHVLPLAPVEDREPIVAAIEEQLTRVDDAVVTMQRAIARLRVLRSAVLDRAWHSAQGLSSLGELSADSDYGTSQKATYESDGPPILRIPNVARGGIDLRDLKFGTKPSELRSHRSVRPGDFLVIRTNGSRDLIGRGGLVEQELAVPHFHASYLIRFRLVGTVPLWRWISLIWAAPVLRRQIEEIAATSAGQYNISLPALARLRFPVPEAGRLQALVQSVERNLSTLDVLETEVLSTLARTTALSSAILGAAFSGRLSVT